MKRLLISLFALVGTAACPAKNVTPSTAPSATWDAAATAELTATEARTFPALDEGKIEVLTSAADEETFILFDTDETNSPVRITGKAEQKKYLQKAADMMSQGFKIQTKVIERECHATTTMGFCVAYFDQTFTMPDGKTAGPFKYRLTSVHRKVNGKWMAVHGHGSSREPAAAK